MNDVLVIDGFQVPTYAQNQQVENDFGRAGGLPTIAPFTTSTFKIKVEDQEKVVAAPLPVVILGVTPKGTANNRAYYEAQYVEGQVAAPDCASSDGLVPDEGDKKQSTICANCPMAVFGSAPGDRKGQACAQGKTLFVVPANKLDSIVYQVRVAPTSLKSVAIYGAKLARAGINPATAITSLGLIPETESLKTYPILKLDLGGFLNQEQGFASIDRSKSPEITSMVVTPLGLPAPASETAQIETQQSYTTVDKGQVDTSGFETQQNPNMTRALTPEEREEVRQAAAQQTDTGATHLDQGPTPDLDSASQPWSADLHSSGKTKLQDGTWRKKAKVKGSANEAGPNEAEKEAEAQRLAATQTTNTTGNELDDALSEWG